MGLFDRFKKKEEEKNTVEKQQPLVVDMGDKQTTFNFNGIEEIDGKKMHKLRLEYLDKESNSFEIRSLYLDVIPGTDQNGNIIEGQDATEQYYRGIDHNTLKAFFDFNYTSKNSLGSDYYGYIWQNENGEYTRRIADPEFELMRKDKYRNDLADKLQGHIDNEEKIRAGYEEAASKIKPNIKTSHAEDLSNSQFSR